MGKATGALTLGVASAIVGMQVYMCMSPKNQKEIQRGLKGAVDDLKDVTERLCNM